MKCSLIILNLDKATFSRRCLESILTRTAGVSFEVITVDNGSRDETPTVLLEYQEKFRARGFDFTIVRNEKNIGAASGRNQGLERARGEHICFLDNDIEVPARPGAEGWLSKLIASLQETGASIVQPKLLFPPPINLIQCAGCGVAKTGRVQFRGRKAKPDLPEFNVRRKCQALISATMVFRASLYREIGGLDPLFDPVEFEEIDFCYRARSRGHTCFYIPEVELFHHENVTTEGHETLKNTYLVVKHGLLFQNRWRAMFERENGPTDAEAKWQA